MHGSNTRRADLIGGPMHGQNSTVSGNDWHLIRQDGRIWFYLWDEIADAYRLDGSIRQVPDSRGGANYWVNRLCLSSTAVLEKKGEEHSIWDVYLRNQGE